MTIGRLERRLARLETRETQYPTLPKFLIVFVRPSIEGPVPCEPFYASDSDTPPLREWFRKDGETLSEFKDRIEAEMAPGTCVCLWPTDMERAARRFASRSPDGYHHPAPETIAAAAQILAAAGVCDAGEG